MLMTIMMNPKSKLDPLYVIFEQHLYNFQDSEQDRKLFVSAVVKEYVVFLRKKSIAVPQAWESAIADELSLQVTGMLVKKIYGCLTIDDYRKSAEPKARRQARSRYSKLASG